MNDSKKIDIVDTRFGKNVTIVNPVNIYGSEIGADVFIGPFVEIQKGTVIGSKTKIQSHSFICEGVEIGENCFIGHGVMFVNDLFRSGNPAGGDKKKWVKSVLGSNVSIGSNATIVGVSICDRTVIGAGSVVTRSIQKPGIYAGNPAKLLRTI
jgi:acetyltransferase-like isoleucine patch superfamily enzyme